MKKIIIALAFTFASIAHAADTVTICRTSSDGTVTCYTTTLTTH